MHKLSSFTFAFSLTILAFLGSFSLALAVSLPGGNALFETSLQSRIYASDTSMTLVSNSTGGESVSGYQCFTIDEGRSDAEFVCGTVSGTSVTNLERGLSYTSGTTTLTARKFAHRVGANVKQTDFPLIQRLRNILGGLETIEQAIKYASSVSTTTLALDRDNLASVGLVQDIAFSGAAITNAATTNKGVVEIATQLETASSTPTGSSGAVVAIPASNATSTYNAATAPLRVVVTKNNGKIDDNFIATSTLLANLSLPTTTAIGAFPSWQIGKQRQIFTSTGTTSFSVPSGITKVEVEVLGGGGGGGSCNAAGSASAGGGGGGAGGWASEIVDVTGTTSIQVFVGSGGSANGGIGGWSTFGTNGFYLSATGGNNGSAAQEGIAGSGGVGSGGDINISGQDGGSGHSEIGSNSAANVGGNGGTSRYGGGAASGVGAQGSNSSNYGGGGGGAGCGSGQGNSGGSGAQGLVIVRW